MMENFEKREEIERKLNYLLENYDNDTILNSFENGLYNDILEFYSNGVIWNREKLINFIAEKKLEYARKKEELVKKKEQEIIINQNLQKQLEENNQEVVKENNEKEEKSENKKQEALNEKEKKTQEEKQKQSQENLLSNNQEKEKTKKQKNDQKQEQKGKQEESAETSKEDELVKIDDVKESTLTEIPVQDLMFEDTQDELRPNISDVGDKKYSDEIEKTQTRIKEYEKTEEIEQPELVSKLEIIKRKAIMDAYDKYLSEKRHELNKLINTYNTINNEYNENYDVEEIKEMIQEIEDILIKVKNLKRKLSFSDISSEENKKIYEIFKDYATDLVNGKHMDDVEKNPFYLTLYNKSQELEDKSRNLKSNLDNRIDILKINQENIDKATEKYFEMEDLQKEFELQKKRLDEITKEMEYKIKHAVNKHEEVKVVYEGLRESTKFLLAASVFNSLRRNTPKYQRSLLLSLTGISLIHDALNPKMRREEQTKFRVTNYLNEIHYSLQDFDKTLDYISAAKNDLDDILNECKTTFKECIDIYPEFSDIISKFEILSDDIEKEEEDIKRIKQDMISQEEINVKQLKLE